MVFSEILPPDLETSSLAGGMRSLFELYEELEAATSAFQDTARARLASSAPGLPRFGCPGGCGACCERFVPDILPVEADYAALWILGHRPELASRTQGQGRPTFCPFYDRDSPEAHCSIYPARPLICRLFGYSAVASKEGLPSYSLCWAMPIPDGQDRRSWQGGELEALFGTLPPLMVDFGLRLQALAPETPAVKPFLDEAIGSSLSRLSFLLTLARQDTDWGSRP